MGREKWSSFLVAAERFDHSGNHSKGMQQLLHVPTDKHAAITATCTTALLRRVFQIDRT